MTSPFVFTPTITAPVLPESDVSYAELDTAVGRLLLATAGGRLVLCAYAAGETEEQAHLARVAAAVSPRVLRLARPLDDARRQGRVVDLAPVWDRYDEALIRKAAV